MGVDRGPARRTHLPEGFLQRAAGAGLALGAGGLLLPNGVADALAAGRESTSSAEASCASAMSGRARRDVQPGPRLVVHRHLALVQPLRPARPRQPGSEDGARARARSGTRTRRAQSGRSSCGPASRSTTASRSRPTTSSTRSGRWATRSTSVTSPVTNIRLGDLKKIDELTVGSR